MQHLIVPPEAAGTRADKFLAEQLPAFSRSYWQKQCEAGAIRQNDKTLSSKSLLVAGEVVVDTPQQAAVSIDLPIIYEDDDVIVINKPAGVLTHAKGVLSEEATVADFVRPLTTDNPDSNRPGIVHRLDRATSGVLIAAKHNEAKRWLQKQFSERKVKKMYLALVEGHLDPPEAVLRLPIGRNPKEPQKFKVDANGKPAETTYKMIRQLPHASLVELWPHTGRTHQLRVHMAYIKHPIVGDQLYNPTGRSDRMFLHAVSLEITLPNRSRQVFSAPLPPALEAMLQS